MLNSINMFNKKIENIANAESFTIICTVISCIRKDMNIHLLFHANQTEAYIQALGQFGQGHLQNWEF